MASGSMRLLRDVLAGCRRTEVEVGAQWAGREVLLPQPWGEFGDAGNTVHADTLQDIDEVVVRIDRVGDRL